MWHSFCNSDINSLQIKKTVLSLIRLQEYSVIKCFLNPTNRGKDIRNYQNFLYTPLLYGKMDNWYCISFCKVQSLWLSNSLPYQCCTVFNEWITCNRVNKISPIVMKENVSRISNTCLPFGLTK